MTPDQLRHKLEELTALPAEVEWVEFKEAKNSFNFEDMGRYFSALSNEANLKGQPCGWLIFGIKDKPRKIIGSNYHPARPSLDRLKQQIAEQTTNRMTFDEIYELQTPQGRVVMFRIPPAPPGIPTDWKGHYYGRNGESLGPLSPNEYDQIRRQAVCSDWSAGICPDATLSDLDPAAIEFAQKQYREKHPGLAEEIDQWDAMTFLNKAKICINSRITNAAIVLLGREESEYFLSPALARITWVLKGDHGIERDYEHFCPPMILAVDQVFARIRNLTYRYLPNASLFPTEITQYDPWVIRETLHNCIAHQDYTQAGRINVVEESESLFFTNIGHFIPGSVEAVICRDAPPEQYRNPFLAQAMVNLNMIDTIGSGIKRMFIKQRERFFPMPDYDLCELDRVKVRLFGKVLDENYTRLLIENTDLSLMDVLALDKVQKQCVITEKEFKHLRKRNLVEGRRPNIYVSAKVAAVTDDKVAYIKNRAFDKAHYKKMILAYLTEFEKAKRQDIDSLLIGKLSDALTDVQKKSFIKNLLQEMKKDGQIFPDRSTRKACWRLSKKL